MPYEGEFAGYRSLNRLAETPRVKQLLARARVFVPEAAKVKVEPQPAPTLPHGVMLPEFLVAIDGSAAETPVKNGYPGAAVGYVTVASVLVNLRRLDELDEDRPIDPVEFRKTEEAATIDAALPGCNVVTRGHPTARMAFRETLYEVLADVIVDEDERVSLLQTYETLLEEKPAGRPPACPYAGENGCERAFAIPAGASVCQCEKQRPIWSTDALRIHEQFRDLGENLEAFGLVMQVWERLLLVHLLRGFERRGWLEWLPRVAFVMDGPLAVFSNPAWLSAPISRALKDINAKVRAASGGSDLLIVGVEKTGNFVAHFEQLDRRPDDEVPRREESEGMDKTDRRARFAPGSYLMMTDAYIKERIMFSDSEKRYGLDTYFGRKFFYKTHNGARLVASIPFLDDAQDRLDTDDVSLYPQFAPTCAMLDRLVTSRFPNALAPLVSAHAQAAIPLQLGAKVLQQLARALMMKPKP